MFDDPHMASDIAGAASVTGREVLDVLADLLRAKLSPTDGPGVEPALLTRQQAAALLAISKSQFGTIENDGNLGPEAITIGGSRCVRYARAELLAWVAAGAPPRRVWKSMRGSVMGRSVRA